MFSYSVKQQKNFINLYQKTNSQNIYEKQNTLLNSCPNWQMSSTYQKEKYIFYHSQNGQVLPIILGSRVFANTEFKLPINDQINFNTQLILKIDKSLYDGPGKLSIIVTMLSEQKQKKIIGSVFANFKVKGSQCHKISQCSCKDKGFQVNAQFEVVNIQNLNINQNNNKFQSPNHQEMKDLKKALTVSRQKQLVKSSRVKPSTATKSPAQKTQPRVSRQRMQKQFKQQMSPDLSSLTTKIVPNSVKLNQQTKKYVNELKDKITELQIRTKQISGKEKSQRKYITMLQGQMQILKSQNQCLIQILRFEQEKSSAAMSYIQYLSQKISQKQLINGGINQYVNLIEKIQAENETDTSYAIQDHKKSIKNIHDCSFNFRPLEEAIPEKQEIYQETNQRLINELETYKISIEELRQKIIDLESQQVQKNENINYLEIQITKINKQNQYLKEQVQKLTQVSTNQQKEMKSLSILNTGLDSKIKQLQKQIYELNAKIYQIHEQKNKLQKQHNKSEKQVKQLKQKNTDLQAKLCKFKQLQQKYDTLVKEHQKIKNQPPKTPLQSQIVPHRSRYQDGGDTKQIQNIIDQLNDCMEDKDLMISSRRVQQNQHFLSRNKSQSLLKDLQCDPQSQDPNTNQSSKKTYEGTYTNVKGTKHLQIIEPQKQMQKYSYDYDIDSLNYFNNFEQDHQRMSESAAEDNTCEIQVDFRT